MTANGTMYHAILYCNSRTLYIGLRCAYSVSSIDYLVIVKSGQSTSSWRLECDYSILGRLAVYASLSVLQCVAVCCSVLQCVAVCCSVLQCVAMCCSVLQGSLYMPHLQKFA